MSLCTPEKRKALYESYLLLLLLLLLLGPPLTKNNNKKTKKRGVGGGGGGEGKKRKLIFQYETKNEMRSASVVHLTSAFVSEAAEEIWSSL